MSETIRWPAVSEFFRSHCRTCLPLFSLSICASGLSDHGLSNNQVGMHTNRTNRVGVCYLNEPGAVPPASEHCRYDMWEDKGPASPGTIDSLDYSANVFAARTIEKIEAAPAATPLYVHLTWQNVHGPYVPPPNFENLKSSDYLSNYCPPPAASSNQPSYPLDSRCNFGGMLKTVSHANERFVFFT